MAVHTESCQYDEECYDMFIDESKAEEFFGGKDAEPKLVSMDPKKAAAAGSGAQSNTSLKSKAQLQKELDAALARIKELEAQLAAK